MSFLPQDDSSSDLENLVINAAVIGDHDALDKLATSEPLSPRLRKVALQLAKGGGHDRASQILTLH